MMALRMRRFLKGSCPSTVDMSEAWVDMIHLLAQH